MSHTNDNTEPLKLHTRRTLDDAGVPAMTRQALHYLCPERDDPDVGATTGDSEQDDLADLDDERKGAALIRLEREDPELYGILYLVDHRGLSLRAVGRHLGLTHPTVSKRRGRALALVRAWCRDMQEAC